MRRADHHVHAVGRHFDGEDLLGIVEESESPPSGLGTSLTSWTSRTGGGAASAGSRRAYCPRILPWAFAAAMELLCSKSRIVSRKAGLTPGTWPRQSVVNFGQRRHQIARQAPRHGHGKFVLGRDIERRHDAVSSST